MFAKEKSKQDETSNLDTLSEEVTHTFIIIVVQYFLMMKLKYFLQSSSKPSSGKTVVDSTTMENIAEAQVDPVENLPDESIQNDPNTENEVNDEYDDEFNVSKNLMFAY